MNIKHKDTGHLSTLSRYIKPGHLRATRMLGFALTLGDHAAWAATSTVFQFHLRPSELASIAIASISALDDDVFQVVMDHLEAAE